jgi:hypothetical protein
MGSGWLGRLFSASFLFIVLVNALFAGGSPQTSNAGLRLSPMRPSGDYILGEPVELVVTLFNRSAISFDLLALLAPKYGNLTIEISDDGKAYKKYVGPGWSTTDMYASPKRFAPSGETSEVVTILWNRPIAGALDHISGEFAFPHSGRYRLRARLADKEPIGESNTVEISIKEPAGDDAVVWEIFKKTSQLAYLIQYPRRDASPEDRIKLETILREYPNTSFTSYIREAMQRIVP